MASSVVVPYIGGYNFGIGVDQASLSPMNLVVAGDPVAVTGAAGDTAEFEVQRVSSTHELQQSLNIDVDASGGSAAFGIGAAGRLSFAQNCKIQSSSLFMVVRTSVSLEFLSIDEPKLTDGASAMGDNPSAFGSRYGDTFVRGIQRGGFFVGVLQIDTEDEKSSETISSELQGSYGLFSADASLKFNQAIENHKASVFVRMYHEGGPVDLHIENPTDPMELLSNANKFLESFQDKEQAKLVAIPYQVMLAPITIADGPLPPNAADLEHCQDVLRFCAKRRSALIDQLNLLEFYIDNASKYTFDPGANLDAFKKAAQATQDDLDIIAPCASKAMNHPSQALFPDDFAKGQGLLFPNSAMPSPLPVRSPAASSPVTSHAAVALDLHQQPEPIVVKAVLRRTFGPKQ